MTTLGGTGVHAGQETPMVRPLGTADTVALRLLCERHPVANVFLSGRLEAARSADPSDLGGTVLGCFSGRELCAAYWIGTNIIPVQATPETNAAVAPALNARPRRSTSIIGLNGPVLDLAERLSAWGRPRWVRADQPLLQLGGPPLIDPDPEVGVVQPADFETVFRASVEMFSEEVGISPIAHGEEGYRARVGQLIGRGETFARFTDDLGGWPRPGSLRQVLFKADIGARSRTVAQIQGVWVHPHRRGEHLAAPAMAQVVLQTRRRFAPIVSLYVNDYNTRARRTYERVGFEQIDTFATVMY